MCAIIFDGTRSGRHTQAREVYLRPLPGRIPVAQRHLKKSVWFWAQIRLSSSSSYWNHTFCAPRISPFGTLPSSFSLCSCAWHVWPCLPWLPRVSHVRIVRPMKFTCCRPSLRTGPAGIQTGDIYVDWESLCQKQVPNLQRLVYMSRLQKTSPNFIHLDG